MIARAVAVLVVLVGCSGPQRRPQTPEETVAGLRAALRRGDPDEAERVLARGRAAWPEHGGLLLWSARMHGMRGRFQAQLADLVSAREARDSTGLPEDELVRRVGLAMFRLGRWGEAHDLLDAGLEEEQPEEWWRTMVALTILLPPVRGEPRVQLTELPLLPGDLPEMLCRIGPRQVPLVLDTGATTTTLGDELARQLGIAPMLPFGDIADGTGRRLAARVGVLPGLALGDVDLGDLPALIVDRQELTLQDHLGGPNRAVAGVVGQDVLLRLSITFDPQRRSVVLEAPRGLSELDSEPLIVFDDRVLVPVRIQGKELWFVLDTGASHSSLTAAGLAALPGGAGRAVSDYRRIHSPGGRQAAVRQVPGLVLSLSAVRFRNVDLPVVDREAAPGFPVHGVLGWDLLRSCRTTVDSGRVRLTS